MEAGHSNLQENKFLLGLTHLLQGPFLKASTMSAAAAGGGTGGEMRKGPWTEQEDLQLVWYVRLFGERRWDFLAKVSGLNRTGKSCRLRWVNYLNPGLKRGRMTPDEENLILELHSKWGNRWSRIAQMLPGRTDNEIKNYWRTHMRKKAQERRISSSPPSPSSSSTTSNSLSSAELVAKTEVDRGFAGFQAVDGESGIVKGYTMDQIWNEIAASDSACAGSGELSSFVIGDQRKPEGAPPPQPPPSMAPPVWEGGLSSSDDQSPWRIGDEFNMLTPMPELMVSNYQHSTEHLL